MSDVFISYSKKDREVAEALAGDLKERGIDVWWDFELYAGEDFHDVIMEQLERAKAVIVIWSENSVQSKWVRGEADEALEGGKLIATHVKEFERGKVPLNFRGVHREDVEDRDRILRALQRKGVAVNPIGDRLPGYDGASNLSEIRHEVRDGLPDEPTGSPSEADEVIWFIGRDGEQHGPLSDDEMAQFHQRGHLRPTDLVWKPELPDWVPAAQLFGFFGHADKLSVVDGDRDGHVAIYEADLSGYDEDVDHIDEPNSAPVRTRADAENPDPNDPSTWGKIARNASCPCGSGKKYKHCHGRL